MKIFSLTLMIVMMICATTFAEEMRPPIITVNGEGIVEAQPDRATISVGVVTREKILQLYKPPMLKPQLQ